MANELTIGSQKLTRDQLSKILPDLRSIKFFENLIADLQNAASSINDRDTVNVWTKNQSTAQFDLTDAPVVALDASQSNAFRLLCGAGLASRKLANPTNATAGMLLAFEFVQPAAGGCALTFDTLYDFGPQGVPSLQGTAGAIDLMLAYFDGTKMVCLFRGSGGSGTALQNLVDAPVINFVAATNTIYRLQMTSAVGSSRVLANPTGLTPGQTWNTDVTQPPSGACSVTFGSSFVWGLGGTGTQPPGSTGPNVTDTYGHEVRSDLSIMTVLVGQTGSAGPGYRATSAAVPTSGGGAQLIWVTQAGLAYTAGCRARATETITGAFFEGLVTSYTGTALTINVDTSQGSSSGSTWNINLAGNVGAGYTATSVTSLTPGTGSRTLVTQQTVLAYTVGARARATSASTGDYFEGLVTAYTPSSGFASLTINADTFSGSTARTDWNINLAGNPGAQGIAGPAGSGNGVNLQTGTTYTYLATDASKLVSHSNAAAIAATLPQATGSFASPFVFDVENRGAGTLTITPTTSTIDGATTLALTTNQGCRIFSDGTNWYTQRGIGGGSVGYGASGFVYLGSNSTISGTFSKVPFSTKQFDTANWFDATTNFRLQPTSPCKLHISTGLTITGATSACELVFFFNGSADIEADYRPSGGTHRPNASAIYAFNGSTDYLEIDAYGGGSGAVSSGRQSYLCWSQVG